MLSHRTLLEGSSQPSALEPLITAAEQALRTWQPVWSGFVAADLRDEAQRRLGSLTDLALANTGGFEGAERRRLVFQRQDSARPVAELDADLSGLEIAGNFLFDPVSADDLRAALRRGGAAEAEIGDLWRRGDRGGQAVVLADLARRLDGEQGQARTVDVRFEARPLEALQLPSHRPPRELTTVEASVRLDAVASAGFGVSRSRMVDLIRQGAVRIDWQPVSTPSRPLVVGERVQLEGRGELAITSVDATKRGRLRIVMLRT
jgi:photosystem II S4 domain protein